MVAHCETLNLSIGDRVSNSRLASKSYAGSTELQAKQVLIDFSADAIKANSETPMRI